MNRFGFAGGVTAREHGVMAKRAVSDLPPKCGDRSATHDFGDVRRALYWVSRSAGSADCPRRPVPARVAQPANPANASARSRAGASLCTETRHVFEANFRVYGVREIRRQPAVPQVALICRAGGPPLFECKTALCCSGARADAQLQPSGEMCGATL